MAARLPCDLSAFNRKNEMKRTTSAENKTLVLEAFDTLFNKRDYVAAERYWSGNYLQHSAHIEPGRNGLFSLIKSLPPTLKYEPGLIVAEGEFVIVHGRFSGHGQPKNWIAADVVRIADGVLVEHWDVIEDEASRAESKSGLPMFGGDFSERASTTCIANQAYRAFRTLNHANARVERSIAQLRGWPEKDRVARCGASWGACELWRCGPTKRHTQPSPRSRITLPSIQIVSTR